MLVKTVLNFFFPALYSVYGVITKKCLPCLKFQGFSLCFLLEVVFFLSFTFKSMICFDLIFVFGAIYGSKLIFSY